MTSRNNAILNHRVRFLFAAISAVCFFMFIERAEAENMQIVVTCGSDKAIGEIYDNPAGRSFAAMLPLTLTMEDYNGTEKISRLNNKLETAGMADVFDPSENDIAYYAPWGNICFFYKDFRPSRSLYPIGKITSGAELFKNKQKDFLITVELKK